ncbi:MAG: helix-turn-helix transcriptional regulator [Oscillospiraceae bacterium]|nr:helix-turn-helix transcriptional regulator [Oscillospiraceae bacterium]
MKARNELNKRMFIDKINGVIRQPCYNENEKYIPVQKGDFDAVNKRLSEYSLSCDCCFSENTVRNTLYSFIIEASSVSRVCIDGGMSFNEASTLAEIYIGKADKCNSVNPLKKLYEDMLLDFAERMQEIRKQRVVSIHIRKCIDYIYEHLGEGLTVNSLAERLGLNPSYLSKLFAKEMGENLKGFVTNARIDTAQNLLRYTELSYLDISEALGFSSQSAFISVFKKCTGFTPKKYRQEFYTSVSK